MLDWLLLFIWLTRKDIIILLFFPFIHLFIPSIFSFLSFSFLFSCSWNRFHLFAIFLFKFCQFKSYREVSYLMCLFYMHTAVHVGSRFPKSWLATFCHQFALFGNNLLICRYSQFMNEKILAILP